MPVILRLRRWRCFSIFCWRRWRCAFSGDVGCGCGGARLFAGVLACVGGPGERPWERTDFTWGGFRGTGVGGGGRCGLGEGCGAGGAGGAARTTLPTTFSERLGLDCGAWRHAFLLSSKRNYLSICFCLNLQKVYRQFDPPGPFCLRRIGMPIVHEIVVLE